MHSSTDDEKKYNDNTPYANLRRALATAAPEYDPLHIFKWEDQSDNCSSDKDAGTERTAAECELGFTPRDAHKLPKMAVSKTLHGTPSVRIVLNRDHFLYF